MANSAWFRVPCDGDARVRVSESAGLAARHAAECIECCVVFLREQPRNATLENAAVAFRNARTLWRQQYHAWKLPCGNGLNVPDLLWLAQAHLFLCSRPRDGADVTAAEAEQVFRSLIDTLRRWDSPSHHRLLAERLTGLENAAMRTAVRWGGQSANKQPRMTNVDLSHQDVSALSIGIDVHSVMDNRAPIPEWKDGQSGQTHVEPRKRTQEEIARERLTDGAWDLDPLLFVILASRVAFFTRLQLALVTPQPGAYVVHRNAIAPDASKRCFHAQMETMRGRHIDDTMAREAVHLGQRAVAGPGALEFRLRLLSTDWHRAGSGAVVRSDPGRRIEDLALSHRVTQAQMEDLFSGEVFAKARLPRDADGEEVVQLLKDVWNLVLLNNEFVSMYTVDFMKRYVVLQHDLRERRAVYVETEHDWSPRLPVLLRACASWCVHLPGEVWTHATLADAVVNWCTLVLQRFGGRTEAGVDIHPLLRELTEDG